MANFRSNTMRDKKLKEAKLNVGEVLSLSYGVFIKNFVNLYCLTVLIIIPALPIMILSPGLIRNPEIFSYYMGVTVTYTMIYVIGSPIFFLISQGAVTAAVVNSLRQEASSWFGCLLKSLSQLPTLIALGLLLVIIAGILIAIISGIFAILRFNIVIFVVIVSIISLIILSNIVLAHPSCVIEKIGAIKALDRSQALIKRNMISVMIITLASSLILGVFIGLEVVINKYILHETSTIYSIGTIIIELLRIIPICFMFVVFAVTYHELNIIKVAYLIEKESSVFD